MDAAGHRRGFDPSRRDNRNVAGIVGDTVRTWRDGCEYRLEVDNVRVRILRYIDNKWITLECQDDDKVRDDLKRLMKLEVRRFDHAMSVWFRYYR